MYALRATERKNRTKMTAVMTTMTSDGDLPMGRQLSDRVSSSVLAGFIQSGWNTSNRSTTTPSPVITWRASTVDGDDGRPSAAMAPLLASERPAGRVSNGGQDPVQSGVEGADDKSSGYAQCQHAHAGPVETPLGAWQSPASCYDELPVFLLLQRQKSISSHLATTTIEMLERRADVDVVERITSAHVHPACSVGCTLHRCLGTVGVRIVNILSIVNLYR